MSLKIGSKVGGRQQSHDKALGPSPHGVYSLPAKPQTPPCFFDGASCRGNSWALSQTELSSIKKNETLQRCSISLMVKIRHRFSPMRLTKMKTALVRAQRNECPWSSLRTMCVGTALSKAILQQLLIGSVYFFPQLLLTYNIILVAGVQHSSG